MQVFKNFIDEDVPVYIKKQNIKKKEDTIIVFNIYNLGHFRFKLVNNQLISMNPINKLQQFVEWCELTLVNLDDCYDFRNITLSQINTLYKYIHLYNQEHNYYEIPEGVLWEYIRDNKGEWSNAYYEKIDEMVMTNGKVDHNDLPNFGNPIGILCSTIIDGEIEFGYSLCNISAGDKFNLKTGMEIALSRCEEDEFDIPQSILNQFDKFKTRSVKYFKQCESFISEGPSETDETTPNNNKDTFQCILEKLMKFDSDIKMVIEKKDDLIKIHFE